MADNNRRYAPVFNKNDPRVFNLLTKVAKKEVIHIYDVDCFMMFRFRSASLDVDPVKNYRPSVYLYGEVEGVFLDPAKNMLFPNRCNQLNFRPDYLVTAVIKYDVTDAEIAILSRTGIYNEGFEFQGKALNTLLDIPCKIDYYAIMNTPVTYIDIQDQYHIVTNSKKSGYTTLMSMFTPYEKQANHLIDGQSVDKSKPVTTVDFNLRERETISTGLKKEDIIAHSTQFDQHDDVASFVEKTTSRVRDKLKEAMQDGNITGVRTSAGKVANDIVKVISEESEKARETINDSFGTSNSKDVTYSRVVNSMIGAIDLPIEVATPRDELAAILYKQGEGLEAVNDAIDKMGDIHMDAESVATDTVKALNAIAEKSDAKKSNDDRRKARDEIRQKVIAQRQAVSALHDESEKLAVKHDAKINIDKAVVKGDVLSDESVDLAVMAHKYD